MKQACLLATESSFEKPKIDARFKVKKQHDLYAKNTQQNIEPVEE